jgi:CRP-like cAMP-binding protein
MKTNNEQASPDCVHCSKRFSSVFCRAEIENLQSINDSKVCSSYKKGQIIFHEGSYAFGLFCINNGKIKVSRNGDDGREAILRLAKPGDILGYKALLTNEKYTASAVALDDCNVCFIPKELFLKVLKSDSSLSIELMRLLSTELGKVETKMTHLAQKPVRERLAETLLFIKETYGFEDDEQTINATLSREEIANIVGTATESAIRLLSEFKKDNIIELDGKKIKIINLEKLIRTANLQD